MNKGQKYNGEKWQNVWCGVASQEHVRSCYCKKKIEKVLCYQQGYKHLIVSISANIIDYQRDNRQVTLPAIFHIKLQTNRMEIVIKKI